MKTTVKPVLNWCLAAAMGLLLAGCSATHVGESWQCPLAQGSSCTSIAEADPAVPAGVSVLFGEPLQGGHGPVDRMAAGGRHDRDETCESDCEPFAWLTRLFRGDTNTDAEPLPPERSAMIAATAPTTVLDGEAPSAAPGSAIAADASLRVPEVLGRIWIAPFVDADGIYREAHWVRVVLEPAGWKLP